MRIEKAKVSRRNFLKLLEMFKPKKLKKGISVDSGTLRALYSSPFVACRPQQVGTPGISLPPSLCAFLSLFFCRLLSFYLFPFIYFFFRLGREKFPASPSF